MTYYTVVKMLKLHYECEAATAAEAVEKCQNENDLHFAIQECDYVVLDEEGNVIETEEN